MTAELAPGVRATIRTAHQALRSSRNPGTYIVEQVVGALAEAGHLASPETAAELEALRAKFGPGPDAPRLTPMERQVIAGIAHGEIAKQTAARLRITLDTVKSHRLSAYRKLGASTAAQAALVADRAGLLTVPAARREGDS